MNSLRTRIDNKIRIGNGKVTEILLPTTGGRLLWVKEGYIFS